MHGKVTYYAQPIARRDDGAVPVDDAVECESEEAAIERADRMSRQRGYIGAWAFCAWATLPPACMATRSR